jgi:hypothetical protein
MDEQPAGREQAAHLREQTPAFLCPGDVMQCREGQYAVKRLPGGAFDPGFI